LRVELDAGFAVINADFKAVIEPALSALKASWNLCVNLSVNFREKTSFVFSFQFWVS
jgi:hypothetical protein